MRPVPGRGVRASTGVDSLITGTLRNLEHLKRESRFDFLDGGHLRSARDRRAGPRGPRLRFPRLADRLPQAPAGDAPRRLERRRERAQAREAHGRAVRALVHLRDLRRSAGTPAEGDLLGQREPGGPASVYDEAKRFAEAITMAYRRYERVDTRIARIFNTYGPRMQARRRAGGAHLRRRRRCAREPITVFGDGSQTRSFCYVDDNVECIVAALCTRLTASR